MKIDRTKATAAFDAYVRAYDTADEKIKLKIDHTYRVCALCEEIAKRAGFKNDEVELAWLMGLLHDVGRFEQLRRYNTFSDEASVDHAALGADILFGQGKIRDYTEDDSEDALLEKVVRSHSAYRLPKTFTEREICFSNLLRDADKIDIFKVNIIVPLEEIYNVTTEEIENCTVSAAVMESFKEEHDTLRTLKKTPVDNIVAHISLAFELVYPVSLKIVAEQGCLGGLMEFRSKLPETNQQLEEIRIAMEQYIEKKLDKCVS